MLPQITVIIAHCQPEFKLILQNIIRSQHRLCLVAIASTVVELLQLAVAHLPDIIIADIALPGMDGLNTLAQLAAIRKPPQFVFSWHYTDKLLLKPFITIPSLSYIAREAAPTEYVIAIRQAVKGIPYHCTQTKKLIDKPLEPEMDEDLPEMFGERDRLLMCCEILGFSCKETAMATGLSQQSVRIYRMRYKKLLGSRSFEVLVRTWIKLIGNRTIDP
jgi:DNA-binding NarL/FixJ family response regulator